MLRPTAERHFHSIFTFGTTPAVRSTWPRWGSTSATRACWRLVPGSAITRSSSSTAGARCSAPSPGGESGCHSPTLRVQSQCHSRPPRSRRRSPSRSAPIRRGVLLWVLYHLSRPAEALAWMCDRAVDLLLLETCVSYSGEDEPFLVSERASSPSQAITGTGCRPSRVWVMNRLREKMPHVYVTATQPRHRQFPLDWRANGPIASTGLARAVFVASRAPLNLPTLVEELPMVQRRC